MSLSRFIFFWIVAGICQSSVFAYMLHLPGSSLMFAIVGHVGSIIAFFISVPRGKGWFSKRRLWARSLVVTSAFLPLFGWLLCGILFVTIYKSKKPLHELGDDDDEQVFESVDWYFNSPEHSTLTKDEMIRQQTDLIPLADVLAGSDIELKRGAVDKLALLKDPAAMQVLLHHRSDPNPEVRFYVTSALTKIKKEYDDQLEAAKMEMQKDVYKVSSRVFLAKIYWQYACSGLIDDASAQSFIKEAEYHLRFVIETPYANIAAYDLLVTILIKCNRLTDAWEILERMRHLSQESHVLKIECDLLYQQGKFRELKKYLKQLIAVGESDPEWVSLANFFGAN